MNVSPVKIPEMQFSSLSFDPSILRIHNLLSACGSGRKIPGTKSPNIVRGMT